MGAMRYVKILLLLESQLAEKGNDMCHTPTCTHAAASVSEVAELEVVPEVAEQSEPVETVIPQPA